MRRILCPSDLAVSKNIVMPTLFEVGGSTKMFCVVILVDTFGQISVTTEHALQLLANVERYNLQDKNYRRGDI